LDTQELLKRESRVNIEAWCRKNTQSLYLGPVSRDTGMGAVLCRVLGKYLMYALSNDQSLMPHLTMDGYWEIWITMAIAKYIKPGMTCVDVGANVGYYSIALADWVGPDGLVVAIEPERWNFAALETNAKRAGQHCVVYRSAASDRTGMSAGTLIVSHGHGGDHYVSTNADDVAKGVRTNLTRLDDIESLQGRSVDFIKMDVEGHERAVWLGMPQILQRSPNLQIAAEWTPRHDPQCELGAMAEAAGFKLHEVATDGTLKPTSLEALRQMDAADWRMLWFKR
jgi:FkbM family methyltransferase